MKYDDELKQEILSHYQSATAKGVDVGATDVLSFSLGNLAAAIWTNVKAMAAWLATNPAGWILGLAAVAFVAQKRHEALTVSLEEQTEIFNDAVSTYESTASELSTLGNELETVRSKLDEINELAQNGKLTPDQEADS